MIENWQTSSLEDVVKFIDYRGKNPQKTESGMRLITAKNVKMGYLQTQGYFILNSSFSVLRLKLALRWA
jgi:type I restriction enzyme, S subunit